MNSESDFSDCVAHLCCTVCEIYTQQSATDDSVQEVGMAKGH